MITYRELEQLLTPLEEIQDDKTEKQYPSSKEQQKSAQNQKSEPGTTTKINQQSKTLNNQSKEKSQPQSEKQIAKYNLNISHKELRKVPPLIPFKDYCIQILDISFNYIKDLKGFKDNEGEELEYLNFSFNFLTEIEPLGKIFKNLRLLDASANRIETVELNDNDFPSLEALYLKNNKIKYFVNCPSSIEILCLDRNNLDKLAFRGGENLEVLSASGNKIEEFEIEECEYLCFLDLEENLVHDMERFLKALMQCQNLLSLNMIGNYVSKVSHKKYIIDVLTTCPQLVKVDEIIINPHVREAFKIMSEEEKMEMKMNETEEKYKYRMQEQLRIKEEMLDKLKNEGRLIEEDFINFMKKEKEQLDALENYAKNNMGKKKLAVAQENKGFTELANAYDQATKSPLTVSSAQPNDKMMSVGLLNSQSNSIVSGSILGSDNQMGAELTKYLVDGVIIDKHKNEYQDFKKTKDEEKRLSKQSDLRKNEGTKEKINRENETDSIGSNDNEELSPQEIERRKKNMNNPDLIYQNSNVLMGMTPLDIDKDLREDEELIFNKKCLPYLVKKYGFHTID